MDWHIDIPILDVYDTSNPVPRSNGKRLLHRAKRKAGKRILFNARLKEIRLATGDYARKYLVDEPLLATKGQEGYDPGVEREVKAALTHKRAPELSYKGQRRVDKVIQGEGTVLKSGYVKTETPVSGKRFMPMVKIVKPYKKIRGEISRQKRELTTEPKQQLPPPEMLPPSGKKIPPRGADYEGGGVPDLFDKIEAAKPTNIKYIYPERQHVHRRTPPTQQKVSVMGRALRDPIGSHLARVEAGLTPSMIQTREGKVPTGLSKTYLPKAFDVEERRKAQVIRDTLAHKLRALRSETIQPMRDIRRKYLGLSKTKLSEPGKRRLWAASEAMGNVEVAYGKELGKPKINPMVPILPRQGLLSPLKPIAEREVHPRVIHAANKKLREAIDTRTAFHQSAADSIRKSIHDRLQERYAKTQSTKLLRETSKRLTNETFSPSRVGTDLEPWEAENLAHDTGTSPGWIRAQHKAFSKHTHLTTGAGEEKLRRAVNLSLFKGIAGAPEEPIKRTYPIFKSIGRKVGIGAGIAGALGLGVYAAHKLMKKKETRFSIPTPGGKAFRALKSKLKHNLGHEIAIGTALTGGITAADAATSAIFPAHGQTRKEAATEGAKRGAVYGSVLSGVEPLIRIPLSRKLHMASKLKEIQFQKWATIRFEDPDIPSPWNKKRRLTVAQDRYRKVIREREIERHEANIGKSALAGAAIGGLLHHKVGARLVPSLAVGAGAGLAAQTAAMIHGRGTKDPYGEASISGKRIERLPYQAGGLAAAGLIGHSLYKRARKVKLFNNPQKLIRFQQFVPAPDETPWYEKEARRFLKHPRSRVENVQKWVGRAQRAREDIGLPRTEKGDVIDPRGRVRKAEWQKPYVKRALYTTGAVSALAGVSLLGRHFYKRGKVASDLLKAGATMSDLKPAERLGLNVTSGNWLRALRKGVSEKFPKTTSGMKKIGGIRKEFVQAKEGVYSRISKAIEGKVGAITGAEMKYHPKTGDPLGMEITNPAKVAEEAAKDSAEKARLEAGISKIRSRHERRIKRQKTRGALESILKPPEEKLSSKLKEIRFQDYEPGYVKVKPHYRNPRSPEPITKKKRFREGALVGAGIAGTGLGVSGGIAWHSLRQKSDAKIQAEVLKRLEEIAAKKVIPKVLSAKIDDLIQFKELSKSEQKRRKGEKGSDRSRTLDALAAGSTGAGLGGVIGGATALREPGKGGGAGGAPKPKWYDPFKNFRPGYTDEPGGDIADYGHTLGRAAPVEPDIGGEEWKHMGRHTGPFQKGRVSRGELESRLHLQKRFSRSKRFLKHGAIGAAIGGTALAAPFLLKKPYPKGGGRETEGKKQGTGLGMQAGLLAGGTLGLLTRHPIGAVAGLTGGVIIGARIGHRIGGAIGSRVKRRDKYAPTTKNLSAQLDDIIALK